MGINAVFAMKGDGFPVEVQFHTEESLNTKMQRCHHSYEKFREEQSMTKAQVRAAQNITRHRTYHIDINTGVVNDACAQL
eukprot:COSAG01_NODE_21144_length_916_cov_0.724602_2_plen_80_part_00